MFYSATRPLPGSRLLVLVFEVVFFLSSRVVVSVTRQGGAELDAFIAENSDVVSAAPDGIEVSQSVGYSVGQSVRGLGVGGRCTAVLQNCPRLPSMCRKER